MSGHADAKKKRRRMKKFVITELSAVDRPAQEGALVTIMKRDDSEDEIEKVLPIPREDESRRDFVSRFMGNSAVSKEFPARDQRLAVANRQFMMNKSDDDLDKSRDRIPILTSSEDGHTHIVWVTGSRGGETTMQRGPDDEHMHDHPWTIGIDGSLVIGENVGHTHTVAPDSMVAAMRALFMAEEDATEAAADVVFAQHADGPPVDLEELKDDELSGLVVKAWLADQFPIRCLSDLRNAVDAFDHAEDQERVASYIVKQARALGLDDELTEDGELLAIAKTVGPADGDPKKGPEMSKTDKTVIDPADHEKVKAELEVSKAFGQLNDEHREHHGKLGEEEASAFLKLSLEDRQSELDKAKADVKVLYKAADGTEYTSADDPRLISSARSSDTSAREVAGMKAFTKNAEYQKRAESELKNMPGEEPVKVALLKAVDTIEDDEVRKGALEIIKAGNSKLAKALSVTGTREGVDTHQTDADEKLNVMAKKFQEDHPGTDFFDAYEKVGEANPELLEKAVNG